MDKKSNEKIVISICTITYNHEEFIRETIESILNQDFSLPIELIIADDNSPDNTELIVNEIVKNHPNGHIIKYFKHKENKGMMENFIWALKQCKGKYVALCEGDDFWGDTNKLDIQYRFLEDHSNFIACYHQTKVIDQENNVILNSKHSKHNLRDVEAIDLQLGFTMPTLTIMFRNIVEDLPTEFLYSGLGDKFLCSFLGRYGSAKYLSNVAPAYYRIGNQGVWSKSNFAEKKLKNFKTLLALYFYYTRVGDNYLSGNYYNRIINQGFVIYPHLNKNKGKLKKLIFRFINKLFSNFQKLNNKFKSRFLNSRN